MVRTQLLARLPERAFFPAAQSRSARILSLADVYELSFLLAAGVLVGGQRPGRLPARMALLPRPRRPIPAIWLGDSHARLILGGLRGRDSLLRPEESAFPSDLRCAGHSRRLHPRLRPDRQLHRRADVGSVTTLPGMCSFRTPKDFVTPSFYTTVSRTSSSSRYSGRCSAAGYRPDA